MEGAHIPNICRYLAHIHLQSQALLDAFETSHGHHHHRKNDRNNRHGGDGSMHESESGSAAENLGKGPGVKLEVCVKGNKTPRRVLTFVYRHLNYSGTSSGPRASARVFVTLGISKLSISQPVDGSNGRNSSSGR